MKAEDRARVLESLAGDAERRKARRERTRFHQRYQRRATVAEVIRMNQQILDVIAGLPKHSPIREKKLKAMGASK